MRDEAFINFSGFLFFFCLIVGKSSPVAMHVYVLEEGVHVQGSVSNVLRTFESK